MPVEPVSGRSGKRFEIDVGMTQMPQAVDRTPVLVAYDAYPAGTARSNPAAEPRPPPPTASGSTPFAAGIGDDRAAVVVEPDGLANLPRDCRSTTDPTGELTAARIADLAYAVETLKARPPPRSTWTPATSSGAPSATWPSGCWTPGSSTATAPP